MTAISPADHQTVTIRLRAAQQRILNDVGQKLATLESLAPSYLAELQRMTPQLQAATARYEQAKADLSLLA
jgi:hypothetical protein